MWLKISFKDICKSCAFRETYVKEDRMFSNNIVINVSTHIGCVHESVCRFYNSDEEIEEE